MYRHQIHVDRLTGFEQGYPGPSVPSCLFLIHSIPQTHRLESLNTYARCHHSTFKPFSHSLSHLKENPHSWHWSSNPTDIPCPLFLLTDTGWPHSSQPSLPGGHWNSQNLSADSFLSQNQPAFLKVSAGTPFPQMGLLCWSNCKCQENIMPHFVAPRLENFDPGPHLCKFVLGIRTQPVLLICLLSMM